MRKQAKIFVAGHRGLVGGALVRKLKLLGYTNILTQSRQELNLLDQAATQRFFSQTKPEYVFCGAAKVGGILANLQQKADFIYENLQVQNNLIHSAYLSGVNKLLFLGSSCIYPVNSPQPIKESALLTGPLEPTNDAYAVAKIAGIVTCQSYNKQYGTKFISVMPTNLYGPQDNFNLTSAHVLPAMMRKLYEAKLRNDTKVVFWGTGQVKREFLHVDDLADACVFLMNTYDQSETVNIGTGEDILITELADLLKEIVGYRGEIVWDSTKPSGIPRKLLDVTYLHSLGWQHRLSLRQGIIQTYDWFCQNYSTIRR